MDRKTEFEHGDQDYGSVYGWDPDAEDRRARDEALAKAKKNNPRVWSEIPEILLVTKASEVVARTCEYGDVQELFGPLWRENEIAIMFGSTGVGKSAFGMQIAESLTRGVRIAPFDSEELPPAEKHRVLYLDFELTSEQFARRYTIPNGTELLKPYKLSPSLFRGEAFWDGTVADGYEDFADMLIEDVERHMIDLQISVLIIDNLTFLSRGAPTNSSVAFRMMERLRRMKVEIRASILAIAHTPKFTAGHHINEDDLQGSVDLAKVADSIFAIGRSSYDATFRYLKQIKSRGAEVVHDSSNIIIYQLGKFDLAASRRRLQKQTTTNNFLGYSYIGAALESEHIVRESTPIMHTRKSLKNLQIDFARQMSARGISSGRIAEQLGISKTTAFRFSNSKRKARNSSEPQRRAA